MRYSGLSEEEEDVVWCRQLALGWANVESETPVKAGTRFCICYKEVIPWVMLPLQIAYVVDRNPLSFAFGSGTLQGHLLVRRILLVFH